MLSSPLLPPLKLTNYLDFKPILETKEYLLIQIQF